MAASALRYGVRRQAKASEARRRFGWGPSPEISQAKEGKAASRFACRRTPYFLTDSFDRTAQRLLTCQSHRFADNDASWKIDGWVDFGFRCYLLLLCFALPRRILQQTPTPPGFPRIIRNMSTASLCAMACGSSRAFLCLKMIRRHGPSSLRARLTP